MRPPRLSVLESHTAAIPEMSSVIWCLNNPLGGSGLQLLNALILAEMVN